MAILVLLILGLCAGSFVNALTWRLYEKQKAKSKKQKAKLSVVRGRSMCPNCQHVLAWYDLIPLLSWLGLKGKCRYCHQPISIQYPLVELATALLFLISYLFWPYSAFRLPPSAFLFAFWLMFLVGFIALAVYDLRWMLLPNKLIHPLFILAVLQTLIITTVFHGGWSFLSAAAWGLTIGGGLFYLLFQVSKGRWIGGGDVKLGGLLGLIAGGPGNALTLLFLASFLGTLVALPLLLMGKVKRTSRLPFGPFLLAAAVIVYLFGANLISWYRRRFLYI